MVFSLEFCFDCGDMIKFMNLFNIRREGENNLQVRNVGFFIFNIKEIYIDWRKRMLIKSHRLQVKSK